MNNADYDRFSDLLQGMADYHRVTLTEATFAVYWRSLSDLSIEVFERALFAHTNDPERGSFMPKVSDVRAALHGIAERDGHPRSDEAWSIAIQARDEGSSVVWTQEIADAFLVAAMPLLAENDKVAARKAFIDRYEVNIANARSSGGAVVWVASLGTDKTSRIRAIEQAVVTGRLTQDRADALLPAPDLTAIALPAPACVETDSESARVQLAKIREMLRGAVKQL